MLPKVTLHEPVHPSDDVLTTVNVPVVPAVPDLYVMDVPVLDPMIIHELSDDETLHTRDAPFEVTLNVLLDVPLTGNIAGATKVQVGSGLTVNARLQDELHPFALVMVT